MIEAFLKVFQVSIDLVRHKATRNSKIFSEVITPMLEELLLIHKDYTEIFERTKSILQDGGEVNIVTLREAEDYLRKKRLDREATRHQLLSTANALSKAKELPRSFVRFVRLVSDYFNCTDSCYPQNYKETRTRILVQVLTSFRETVESGKLIEGKHHYTVECFEHALDAIRLGWLELCEEYARLKVKSVF